MRWQSKKWANQTKQNWILQIHQEEKIEHELMWLFGLLGLLLELFVKGMKKLRLRASEASDTSNMYGPIVNFWEKSETVWIEPNYPVFWSLTVWMQLVLIIESKILIMRKHIFERNFDCCQVVCSAEVLKWNHHSDTPLHMNRCENLISLQFSTATRISSSSSV